MNHSFFKVWERLSPTQLTHVELIDQARNVYATTSNPQTKASALRVQTRAQIRHDRDMRVKHRARELQRTFAERRQQRAPSLLDIWCRSIVINRPWAVVRMTGI